MKLTTVFGGATLVLGFLVAGFAADVARANDTKFTGVAAYYDKDYKGRTASGVNYDPSKLTAAHRTLPFGTRVRVTDPRTNRSVVVVVNDRGPFNKGRVIDLSLAAAKELRMIDRGLIRVTAQVETSSATTEPAPATR